MESIKELQNKQIKKAPINLGAEKEFKKLSYQDKQQTKRKNKKMNSRNNISIFKRIINKFSENLTDDDVYSILLFGFLILVLIIIPNLIQILIEYKIINL